MRNMRRQIITAVLSFFLIACASAKQESSPRPSESSAPESTPTAEALDAVPSVTEEPKPSEEPLPDVDIEVPARLIRPLFSYLMARAGREICLQEAAYHGEEPFMISRCAMPGTQRIATTWTGDNYTDFRDLRFNHYQAMTMSLSGFAFFGQDIGGFAGPKPGRELFLRWLQYAVFTPRFVLHSWKPGEPSNMPWLYEDLMPEVRKLFDLREKLVPYLHEQFMHRAADNLPLIWPVFLDEPGYDPEADCFLCGESILACPVFDAGNNSVHVKLPSSSSWKLRGEGDIIKGGTELDVACAPCDLPVWFEKA